jgi:hypothetical protein
MSTSNEPPVNRPRPDEVRHTTSGLIQNLRENSGSIRQSLTLAGMGGVVLGGLVWLFVRDLSGPALIVVLAGVVLLLAAASMSWRSLIKTAFGRGGKYGINTVTVLLITIGIAAALNYLLFYAANRPNPPGFLRIDTTYTKQFLLGEKVQTNLNSLKEPVRITAFFPTANVQQRNAWKRTEDTLSEFRRRSTKFPLEYRQVDPELNPNEASLYNVTSYPALVVEGMESQRREIILPSADTEDPTQALFTEQDILTGLLVVNQIRQKHVMFISGHSERTATDTVGSRNYGLAFDALVRENYFVTDATLQELGSIIIEEQQNPPASADQSFMPAAVIFADPRQDMTETEGQILREYALTGGSILLLLEPDTTPETFLAFLSRYGIAVGLGQAVDIASYIAPNPQFLQIKASNLQFIPNPITTDFDVVYLPGSTYFATTVDPETIPLQNGTPYIDQQILARTTLDSWAELSLDGSIAFDEQEGDLRGPLPVAITLQAIAELQGTPYVDARGELIKTNMVIIGDTDFASNQAFASAKNGDLLLNSVRWLVQDYELISITTKTDTDRIFWLTTPERDYVRWSGWLLMPSLIAMAGVWVWWRRR